MLTSFPARYCIALRWSGGRGKGPFFSMPGIAAEKSSESIPQQSVNASFKIKLSICARAAVIPTHHELD